MNLPTYTHHAHTLPHWLIDGWATTLFADFLSSLIDLTGDTSHLYDMYVRWMSEWVHGELAILVLLLSQSSLLLA